MAAAAAALAAAPRAAATSAPGTSGRTAAVGEVRGGLIVIGCESRPMPRGGSLAAFGWFALVWRSRCSWYAISRFAGGDELNLHPQQRMHACSSCKVIGGCM